MMNQAKNERKNVQKIKCDLPELVFFFSILKENKVIAKQNFTIFLLDKS